jgi:hypothetical protein
MSICGAFEFSRKGDWKLFHSKITVYMHDTIDTRGLNKNDVEILMNQVRSAVAAPVNEFYGVAAKSEREVEAAVRTSPTS